MFQIGSRHHCPSSGQDQSNHLFDRLEEISGMDFTAVLLKIVAMISEACRKVDKLPAALITGGIVQAAVALALAIFRPPAGIFVGHGEVPLYLYYGILVVVIIFGLVEASAGFYVSGDLHRRRTIGMTILWISVLPIVLVAGLGGFLVVLK
ncbi:hypothetical protein HU200_064205 [Digitaria exilis]|uniref:Uncharacterized protein n=1 Tax=Digitaria exilis TaxID=1010633 RepID=A0A835A5X3_9POAL|nr:hypothetical protein HU200_064205 [Digitaria exilis]